MTLKQILGGIAMIGLGALLYNQYNKTKSENLKIKK